MLYMRWTRTGNVWLQWLTILVQPQGGCKQVLTCWPRVWIWAWPHSSSGTVQLIMFFAVGGVQAGGVPCTWCGVAVEGEDGFESKWVIGFAWHIEEPVSGNFPLYIADASVNLFVDCISYYLWNLISICFLLCFVFPTCAFPSSTSQCWFFLPCISCGFFLFYLVLHGSIQTAS